MAGPPGWAGSLAVISVLLALGVTWLRQNRSPYSIGQKFFHPFIEQLALFFYFVGLPYLALITGILTPRLLGLKGLEYLALNSPTTGKVDIQQAVILMAAEWLTDVRVTVLAGLTGTLFLAGLWLSLVRKGSGEIDGFFVSPLDTLYAALHWAFYRAIFWQITSDLYLGLILGTVLVITEWLMIARIRQTWIEDQSPLLINAFILILTGTIFFYSPNLWLLWPIHLGMVTLVQKTASKSDLQPTP